MGNVIHLKGRDAPSSMRSVMETKLLTPAEMSVWVLPPFQREKKVNEKLRQVCEQLKHNGGFIPGVLTLGMIPKDKRIYLVDGQHRRDAFFMSELPECIADCRMCEFESMADMAKEYVELNSNIVKMAPDDFLRGLESSTTALAYIRKSCDFVGYGHVRRNNTKAPVLSMSAVIRCWSASAGETPAFGGGKSAMHLAEELDELSAQNLVAFLLIARSAWGNDPEYFRMWGNLNLTICMWLYRKLVMDRDRGVKRYVVLSPEQFRKCLMSASAAPDYVDWLTGRMIGERDRSPCFLRLKAIFQSRLRQDSKDPTQKQMLPSPAWASK